ncbi:hypothetical protein KQX64_06980 [Rhodopseudomonas palustris]|nr:hypothetical protein KQX64_06980 [Rhodopseudomonas palustris]
MVIGVAISDQLIRRVAEASDFRVVSGADIRRVMRRGFDSFQIARAYDVSEASVWNRLIHDDRSARL